jgi:hypothetical protein
MAPGLFAALDRDEEVALRRVAYGVSKPRHHFTPDLTRLRTLALIDECDGQLHLTALGLQWISQSAGRLMGSGTVMHMRVR